jgi:hypothetical protein
VSVASDDDIDEAPDEFDGDIEDIDEDLDDDIDEDLDEDLDDDVDDDAEDDDLADYDEDEDEDDDDERDEALEELEAEELEIEDDPETLLVDEAAEIRELRREELGLDAESQEVKATEFVCSECFLVKSTTQLANKARMVCRDCV